jgi:chorismate dehydratase
MLRLGFVPYANAYPFRNLLSTTPPPYIEEIAPPVQLNTFLLEKKVDVALCSSALLIENELEYLPHFCIGSEGNIGSVILYHKEEMPLEEINFYLDPHSLTSNTLLFVIARHFWGFNPKTVSSIEESDGFLKIGDFPLRGPLSESYQALDLGATWHSLTGLPFVYALFLYPPELKESDPESLIDLSRELHFSYETFLNRFEEHLPLFAKLSKISSSTLRHYFKLCQHRLTPKHCEGLRHFIHLARESHVLANAT